MFFFSISKMFYSTNLLNYYTNNFIRFSVGFYRTELILSLEHYFQSEYRFIQESNILNFRYSKSIFISIYVNMFIVHVERNKHFLND